MTDYKAFPATAEAGPATIVFENSMATGSTFGMSHTLTFDTSSPGYNHDVNLNILASPFDANGGRHEAQVTFTPGKYRYFCAIPGHGEMWGELVVTDGGTGGEDTTAPSVTALVTGEQDGDGAYVGGATVTLDATDDDSGVAGVEYDLDGAGWQAYTEPFVVDAVGAHTLQFRATDAAGNTSEAQTASFTVVEGDVEEDTTAPVVEPMVMGQQDEDGAYVGTAAFMLHATDEGSGVASVEYQVDGGAWLPYTTTVPFTEVGEHTVSFRATDVAGNVSEVGSVTFTVVAGGGEDDTTAPTVTAEVTGTQDGNGAFVGSATATLTATDDASGVESVEYDLDGAGWQPYTEPVVVDEPGEHTLVYRATDVAGNVSEETVTEFVVVAEAEEDTTAPIVATELSGQQDEDGAYVGSASVLLTATDDGSGRRVRRVRPRRRGLDRVHRGRRRRRARPPHARLPRDRRRGERQRAGDRHVRRRRGPGRRHCRPDRRPPRHGRRQERGRRVPRQRVRAPPREGRRLRRRVGRVPARRRRVGPVRQADLRADPGSHTVTYRATDVAGNVSAPKTVTFVIAGGEEPGGDTDGPVVTAGVSGSRTRDGDFVASARVTLTAVDEESGVDRIEFQANDGAWQRYAAPVAFAADGQHVVRYRAVDGVGNVTSGEVTFTVLKLVRDRCVGSDIRPTVIIDGHDSTVQNYDDGTGCTVNDHVAENDEYATHREFVDHVSLVTEDLVLDGVLDDAERDLVITAAQLSDIGRR